MEVNAMEIESYYFPVNLSLVKQIVGKMLTHIEAMNLSERAEKANKDLVNQTIWKWWSDVQENSMTSWKGCIGPLRVDSKIPAGHTGDSYVWYTDIGTILPTTQAKVPWRDVSEDLTTDEDN